MSCQNWVLVLWYVNLTGKRDNAGHEKRNSKQNCYYKSLSTDYNLETKSCSSLYEGV